MKVVKEQKGKCDDANLKPFKTWLC
jgi:hypothetical protein